MPSVAFDESARGASRRVPAAPPLPRIERFERTVTALHQGPGLRKLLGSASELWDRLQRKTRRHPEHMVETSVKALAGRYERPRTIEWGLKRLEDAGLIRRERMRYGVRIFVLSFDTDDDGMREFSPRLEPATVVWMRAQRKRGRPKRPKGEPMQEAQVAQVENVRPIRPPETRWSRDEVLKRAADHPDVPRLPLAVTGLRPPRLPMPPKLDPNARPSERREFLIEAYATSIQAFWPGAPIGRACKALRTRSGFAMLDEVAAAFLDPEAPLEPHAWLHHEFAREVSRKRKAPPRAEVAYEPTRIMKFGPDVAREMHESELFTIRAYRAPEVEVTLKGLAGLQALYERTLNEIGALPDLDDREAISRVCRTYWPTGWRPIYETAIDRVRAIEAELERRVLKGQYIWKV